MTNARDELAWAKTRLAGCIPEPVSLDAEWLLAHVLECDRSAFHLPTDPTIDEAQRERFRGLVEARAEGQPVAQLIGEWEFYGLPFFVTPAVLVPRPDTELLVDWLRDLVPDRANTMHCADLGTGTGCLAIAIAHCWRECRVDAYEIDDGARDVAVRNIARHGLEDRVDLCDADYTERLARKDYDWIVANPPYIAPGDPELTADVARFEPRVALMDDLDGDGLGHYRRIAQLGPSVLREGGGLLLEVGETQAAAVTELFKAWGPVSTRRDLAGILRAILVRAL